MPLLLDTYNILHVVGVLPPEQAGLDVGGLLAMITRSRHRGEPAILVCDGLPSPGVPRGRLGTAEVRFAGPGRTADEVIIDLIRRSTAPRALLVVTSDRAVLRAARRRRCRTLRAETFLRRLLGDSDRATLADPRPSRPTGSLSHQEVARWMDRFQVPPELAVPRSEPAPQDAAPGRKPASGDSDRDEAGSEQRRRARRGHASRRRRSGSSDAPFPPEVLDEAGSLWSDRRATGPADEREET